MIKWEHSIFALPFALCGAILAAGGVPSWRQLGWIIVAMVAARSAAMAFNRLADASIDAANSRTRLEQGVRSFVCTDLVRGLCAGSVAAESAYVIAIACGAGCGVAVLVYQAGKRLVALG